MITQHHNLDDLIAGIADQIAELVRQRGLPCSEIAVLYTSKNLYGEQDSPVPERIAKALEGRGILNGWVAQDYRAKLEYDITSDRVTISTIHSAKGLDWAVVFLLGMDTLDLEKKGILARNLVYVGITRAKYWLFVPYLEDGQSIKALLKVQ